MGDRVGRHNRLRMYCFKTIWAEPHQIQSSISRLKSEIGPQSGSDIFSMNINMFDLKTLQTGQHLVIRWYMFKNYNFTNLFRQIRNNSVVDRETSEAFGSSPKSQQNQTFDGLSTYYWCTTCVKNSLFSKKIIM